MAQLANPVEPFGEVNVHRRPDGALNIVATILREPDIEGSRTCFALDASASMKKLYGISGLLGGAFAKAAAVPNVVQDVARSMARFLAGFSADGRVDCSYWACGADGTGVEDIGRLDHDAIEGQAFAGPKKLPWGRATRLLPVLRRSVEVSLAGAPWGMAVFVTDGKLDDLADVKAYSLEVGRQIAAGRRKFVKFVIIGLGEAVDPADMAELDDMFEGSGLRDPAGHAIDLWDHKLAKDMRQLGEIFAEVVTEDLILMDWGRVDDSRGRTVHEWKDGLPALLRFTLPAGERSFRLVFQDGEVVQDLTEALS